LIRCLIVSLWLTGLLSFPAWAETAVPNSEDPSILREAAELVRTRALYPPPDEALAAARDVRDYLSALGDPYSTYLSREERRVLEDLDQPNYAGVGMEVIRAPGKGILCVPFDAGPAHQAGIRSGDRLLAVDNKNIAAASLELLPSLVRGPVGKPVVLTVAGADGHKREVKVFRDQVNRRVVESGFEDDILKIRIYRFEKETPNLVAEGVRSAPDQGKALKVLIDLRGNIGGELKAALDTAALFLPPGSLLASVTGRPGVDGLPKRHQVGPAGGNYAGRRIVIWQDQMTASASEVFIAALTHHGAAITVGRPTFGKGLVQETFPAPDGGLFIITTGELFAPDNKSFNNKGLPPRLPLRDSGRDKDYYARTKEAFAVIAKIMTERATGRSQPQSP